MYGVDLAELFRKKRWVHLLALIYGLPAHSRYMCAVLTDPEMAEQIVNDPHFAEAQSKDTGPSPIGYSQENYQLAEINDGIKALQSTLVAVNGGKSKTPKPTPRPVFALEKAKKDAQRKRLDELSDLFFK